MELKLNGTQFEFSILPLKENSDGYWANICLSIDNKNISVELCGEYLTRDELKRLIDNGDPLEFSHTLDSQIGGQTDAGFAITGFFEDNDPSFENAVAKYCDTYFATKAVKL